MASRAQQIGLDETIIPKSPIAAALDKMDQVPVELSTGGAIPSFDLYHVKYGSIDLPLSLSYHSGGIKVDESPTWVGLGWMLNEGGCISRTINGNPDEGIYINKEKKYYLQSSTGVAYKTGGGAIIYDTSAATKSACQSYFGSACTVKYDYYNTLYKLAVQNNMWGGYGAIGVFAGLSGQPQLYQDVVSTNANVNKPALPTSDQIYTSTLVDPQPDEFTIKIPGYTGTFSFNTAGVPQLYPVDNDIKISYVSYANNNDTTVAPYIDTWVISTSDGKQYYFGYGANAKTSANGVTGSRANNFFSPTVQWDLTKIVDVNSKDSVVFAYKHVSVWSGRKNIQHISPTLCASLATITSNNSITSTTVQSVLTTITTNKETVYFYSGLDTCHVNFHNNSFVGWSLPAVSANKLDIVPRLDSIAVYNNSSGAVVTKYLFTYDHFQLSGKLKLLSYQRLSMDQLNILPPTQFGYYDTTVSTKIYSGDTVVYTPMAQDYWGYYNNAQQNYKDYAVYPDSCAKLPSRKPAWPYMQLGVLNRITNPTGGQLVFEYEPHKAKTFFDNNGSFGDIGTWPISFNLDSIGGIRIKKVKLIDSTGKTTLIHQYTYTGNDGASSGHLNITPSMLQPISQALCFTSSRTDYLMQSNVNLSPYLRNSAVVNYGQVTETIMDSLGNSNGYTVHTFYNDANLGDTSFLSSTCLSGFSAYAFNGLGNMPAWLSHHSKGSNLLNGYEMGTQVFTNTGKLVKKKANVYAVKQFSGLIAGYDFLSQSLDNICNETQSSPIDFYSLSFDTAGRNLIPPSHYYYYIQYYGEYPKMVALSKTTEVVYSNTTNDSVVNVQQFYRESPYHINTTRTVGYSSMGDTLTTVNIYAFDLKDTVNTDTTPKILKTEFYNPVISSTAFKSNNITASKISLYKNFGTVSSPALFPQALYVHRATAATLPLNTFGANNVVSYPVSTYFPDNSYQLEETYSYNANGKLLTRTKVNNEPVSYVWDYYALFPVAEVINANVTDVAYTSFEADGSGGWTFSGLATADSTAPTGNYCYSFSNGSISKSGLTSGRHYWLSSWVKGTPNTITGTISGYPLTGKTVGSWTNYLYRITGVTSVSVSGSGYVDELRLYPDSAQMTSYTYDPFAGPTTITDLNNRIGYYQYDGLKRLAIVKDQDKNIASKICYNYTGEQSACQNNIYYNAELSQSFTKNNCGSGYLGSSVLYIVAQGKYTAATAAAANQLAQSDITANGQNYANSKGSCTKIYYSVAKSGTFSRNNCGAGYTGSSITYTVPANTYSSIVSQSDADQQAQNDVNSNGQAYANANGTCSSNVSITSVNYASVSGFTAVFTNTSTSQQYSFTIPAAGGTLGTIPSGSYTVVISKTGNTTQYFLAVCDNSIDGASSATFNNMAISSSCNTVTIDYIE